MYTDTDTDTIIQDRSKALWGSIASDQGEPRANGPNEISPSDTHLSTSAEEATALVDAELRPDVATPAAPPTTEVNVSTAELPPRHVLDQARPLDFDRFPFPPRKTGHSPAATIANVQHLLTEYGITTRYDVIKKKLLVGLPGHSGSADNFDNVAITQINSLATLNGMSLGQVPSIVEAIADRNLYNPAADWINVKPWDGSDRLPDIYATLHERGDFPRSLKETLIYRWLLSAVAAALEPSGFSCRGVLTLQGPQGIGKTRWTSALVTDLALAKQVVRLGHHLDAGDKDSQLSAITHWIVEIGELDGSLRKDIARLKGFLTADQDKIRRPYGRTESQYPRKTVFCATVNDDRFLVDPTGNSRWWTIPVTFIDYAHGVDMQQVFAQLAVDYRAGAEWWLSREEDKLLAAQNALHRTESVILELVLGKLDLERMSDSNLPVMNATELLRLVGIERPTNAQLKECCGVLRDLLGESKRIRGQQKWNIPLVVGDRDAINIDDDIFY